MSIFLLISQFGVWLGQPSLWGVQHEFCGQVVRRDTNSVVTVKVSLGVRFIDIRNGIFAPQSDIVWDV